MAAPPVPLFTPAGPKEAFRALLARDPETILLLLSLPALAQQGQPEAPPAPATQPAAAQPAQGQGG